MLGCIVDVLDVVNIQEATAVLVNLSEGLLNECLPEVVKLSPDSIEELIDVEGAISVGVEDVEEHRHVLVTDAHLEVSTRLGELRQRDALAVVVVHDEEQLLQANDAPSPSSLDLVSEQPHQSSSIYLVSRCNSLSLS